MLQRREISRRSLAAVLFNFPLMTIKVIAAIHWQALRLWLKGCKVYDHPMHDVSKQGSNGFSGHGAEHHTLVTEKRK
jgi:DUF1365 family protein